MKILFFLESAALFAALMAYGIWYFRQKKEYMVEMRWFTVTILPLCAAISVYFSFYTGTIIIGLCYGIVEKDDLIDRMKDNNPALKKVDEKTLNRLVLATLSVMVTLILSAIIFINQQILFLFKH